MTQPLLPAMVAAPRSGPDCRGVDADEPRGAALPPPLKTPARKPRQPASHRWPQARTRRPPAAAMPTRFRRVAARAILPSARRMPSAQWRRPITGSGGDEEERGGGGAAAGDGTLRTKRRKSHRLMNDK